jgi:hypothetical protein
VELDQDLEFDRLSSDLLLPAVEDTAAKWFSVHRRLDQTSVFGHLQVVSKDACALFDRAADEMSLSAKRYWTKVCEAAGLLHESIVSGRRYEDVVAAADDAVANTVAALTPDIREPYSKRSFLLANRVGNATLIAKAVKLADIGSDLEMVEGMEIKASNRFEVRSLLSEMKEILLSMAELRRSPAVAARVDALRKRVEAVLKATKSR